MEQLLFSHTTLTVSRIIYGVWRLEKDPLGTAPEVIERKIQTCLEVGIQTFDHADLYGNFQNEGLFGKVLQNQPSLRQQMVLITKCGIQFPTSSRPENRIKHYNTTQEYIIFSAERSLKELCTDYLDILLIHRPNPLMDAQDTAEAFEKLIDSGKIRYAGVSNFTNAQFELLDNYLTDSLITNQIELNLLHNAPLIDGTLDYMQMHQINPMVWSPLAGGRLFSGTDEQSLRVQKVLEALAPQYNASPEQIALAWLLKLPSKVLPVIGTNNVERIQEAARSIEIELDLQDWFALYQASLGEEVP